MSTDVQYAGSLTSKRKAELSEIASLLGVYDSDAKNTEIIRAISAHMDTEEATLIKDPRFKGLYVRRGTKNHDSPDHTSPPASIKTISSRARKSINAASIPLPESPLALSKVANQGLELANQGIELANTAATQGLELANQGLEIANRNIATIQETAVALVPTEGKGGELVERAKEAGGYLVRFGRSSQGRVDDGVRVIRDHLSIPENILITSITLEGLALLIHVTQWYQHTIFFPPTGGEIGSLASLYHTIFAWAPSVIQNVMLPEGRSLGGAWPALTWWVSATVLPPLALSTLVSFVPQRGQPKTGHNTRYASSHPPLPTVDPLAFALFRLAALVLPLTSAAPSAMVDALGLSGNAQGRVLGAALVVGLILASRLS